MPEARTEKAVSRRAAGKALVRFLVGGLFVAYPFVVYLALTRWGARTTALVVLGALVLWGLKARMFGRQGFRTLLVQVGGIAALSLGSLVSGHPAWIQQMPVLISAFLLVTFLSSLFRPPSMIERYARMVQPDLSDAEVRHCRAVTQVWVVFFVVNAGIAEGLALWGSVEAWALYAGAIAYVLMGVLFTVEYVVRKARFGRFGDGLHDRLLARLLRRRAQPGAADGEVRP